MPTTCVPSRLQNIAYLLIPQCPYVSLDPCHLSFVRYRRGRKSHPRTRGSEGRQKSCIGTPSMRISLRRRVPPGSRVADGEFVSEERGSHNDREWYLGGVGWLLCIAKFMPKVWQVVRNDEANNKDDEEHETQICNVENPCWKKPQVHSRRWSLCEESCKAGDFTMSHQLNPVCLTRVYIMGGKKLLWVESKTLRWIPSCSKQRTIKNSKQEIILCQKNSWD